MRSRLVVVAGVLCLCCAVHRPALAQKYTISGYVQDAQSGERLIGANLYVPALEAGTTTNTYGFFSLTLPADSVALVVSYIGYRPTRVAVRLDQNLDLTVALAPASAELDEVEVVAERGDQLVETSQMSSIDVPIAQVQTLPALLGEVDVLKTLQLLPGVQSGGEGTSGLYVRGGGPDQNLMLLDGAPVYNAAHLFGFFSVFNADAVRSVQLIKGGFPARYGGRLSSVVDIHMKEGNLKEFAGAGSLGLVAARLTVEGPIVKDRTSFIVSGRRTYIDLLARPFIRRASRNDGDGSEGVGGYYFYDVNAKVNHRFSDRDRLYLSVYAGNDVFYISQEDRFGEARNVFDAGLGWGNVTSSLRWNHQWNSRLFSNASATYSRYEFEIEGEESTVFSDGEESFSEVLSQRYFSGIRDWSGRIDFDFVPAPAHYIRFGAYGIFHTFRPGAAQFRETFTDEAPTDTTFAPSDPVDAGEFAVYLEDDLRLGRRLKANLGLHLSALAVNGAWYRSVQPRLSTRYLLTDALAVKASFVTMTQYIHLLTNSGIGLPTDLWLPATDRVRPQQAWQAAAGVARTVGDLEVSLEGYYKRMNHLIEYKEGAGFFGLDTDWQDEVESGRGVSYGAEMFVQKQAGRTSGWVGYTLSWSKRQFENLNFGNEFPYRYDRRHDFSIALVHQWTERIDLGVTWVYGTGNAVSLPIARFQTDEGQPGSTFRYSDEGNLYTERNGYRMRAYHRLDVAFNWRKERRWGERVLSLGLYNAYSRRNPFYLYIAEEFDGVDFDPGSGEVPIPRRVFKQVSLFPILPSISYRFTF